jgi:hypothetical protein
MQVSNNARVASCREEQINGAAKKRTGQQECQDRLSQTSTTRPVCVAVVSTHPASADRQVKGCAVREATVEVVSLAHGRCCSGC